MAVEFSRRPLLSLLLSLWLSTSTAAAIGWRANRVEHYWSAVLCHTDHSVPAPLVLLKCFFFSFFAAMQTFLTALDGLFLLRFSRSFLGYDSKSWRGFDKTALMEIIFVVAMHNSMAVLFVGCVRPGSERGPVDLYSTPITLRTDISN